MPRARIFVSAVVCLVFVFFQSGCQRPPQMGIEWSEFGAAHDRPVVLYTLHNGNGMTAKITNYGAIVTELHAPGADGYAEDIVLGFDTLAEYVDHNPYFGCIAGRCANRIAQGRFSLDGNEYQLTTNNGPHHLHGGARGFDKHIWLAEPVLRDDGPSLILTLVSPDGDEGYPGNLLATVIYTLTTSNELVVEMSATTDAATIVNLAHHTYWNLAGHDSGDVLNHWLMINAEQYTPADETLIPTGEIAPVAGTPFDFSDGKEIGDAIGQLPPSGDDPGGYDINYVLSRADAGLTRAAVVSEPRSGRVMEIWTNQPGLQFYSGNFLDGVRGKGGAVYEKHDGFCLETQKFPDAVNKEGRPGWPSVILRPGGAYHHIMVHRFLTK